MTRVYSVKRWGKVLLLSLLIASVSYHLFAQGGNSVLPRVELTKFIDKVSKEKNWKLLYDPADLQGKYIEINRLPVTRDWDITSLSSFIKKYDLELQQIGENTYAIKQTLKKTKPNTVNVEATTFKVKGRVFNIKEPPQPMPGVSVTVRNAAGAGVLTDADGYFEIDAKKDDLLEFNFIGYKSTEYPVSDQKTITVSLAESANALGDVMVSAGYSSQKQKYLASSISTVNMNNANNKPITQLSQALQGGATGVFVNQGSGLPGSDVAAVKIRGVSSFLGSSPLTLVDGVVMDMNLVDYATVESISILKDAAAASIYGARAGNGVILITTKRGVAGKPVVQYNGYAGVQVPTYMPHFVDAATYMTTLNEAQTNVGGDPLFSAATIALTKSKLDPVNYPDTKWSDVLQQRSATQQHSLSVSGGNSTARFALTANYVTQNAILSNTRYNRASIRANTSIDLRKNIVVFMDMMVTRTQQTVPYSYGLTYSSGPVSGTGQVLSWIYTAPPTIITKYPNKDVRPGYTYYGTYGESWNPVAQLEKGGTSQSVNDQAQLNLRPKWTIIPGLDLKGQFSYQVTSGVYREKRDAYLFYDYFTENPTGRNYTDIKSAGPRNRTGYYYLGGNLDYVKLFGQHRLNVLAGYSQELTNTDSWTEKSLRSVFSKAYYSYANKYIFELGMRGDGSSLFAPGKKWGAFPSVAIGWNLAQEGFMKQLTFIDQLKLRASYGMLGNNDISPYLYQSTISTSDGSETSNANIDISWEKLAITDIGANISMFHNKLDLTLDYYYKKTTGMILYPQPSLTSGLLSFPKNVGSMQNKGLELALGYSGTVTKHFMFNVSGGVSYNKSKILRLATNPLISGDNIYREGGEMGEYYGYKANGLLQEKDMAAGVPILSGQKAGDIRYVDVTGDKIISDSDRVSLGNIDPRLTYFTNLSLYIGQFDVEALVNGAASSHLQYSSRIANPLNTAGNGGTPQYFQLDYWTPEHTTASRPRLTPTPGSNGLTSDFWITGSAFARIRYISLGYTFKRKPGAVPKKIRIYVNAQNPFTFSKVKVIDPESKGNEGTYPIMRVYTFGVNLSL